MQATEIKRAANLAAKSSDINLGEHIKDYSFADEMYFLSMLFYYKSFYLGAISQSSGQAVEQQLGAKYKNISTAFYFSKGHYDRMISGFAQLGQLKQNLVMQMKSGDKAVINTLFQLLDYYTNDNIYAKLFLVMKSGQLNDTSLEEIIAACPEEYRRSMTLDECRETVWNFIKVMNGEITI